MSLLDIKVPSGSKVAVIGDIHEHREQFNSLLEIIKPSPKIFFVSLGDIYDKGFGIEIAEDIIDKLMPMVEAGYGYVLRGNHELKHIRKARQNNSMNKYLEWFDRQPLAVSFKFSNNTRLTVVHGGVLPSHTWQDINNDIETSYIRNIDDNGKMIKLVWQKSSDGKTKLLPEKQGGQAWHKSYDGRFGYIISGHDAQKDGVPKFYNYSCNIDTSVYTTGVMTAQVFSEHGKDQLIMVSGPAKKPEL